jgi:hypothetical protein
MLFMYMCVLCVYFVSSLLCVLQLLPYLRAEISSLQTGQYTPWPWIILKMIMLFYDTIKVINIAVCKITLDKYDFLKTSSVTQILRTRRTLLHTSKINWGIIISQNLCVQGLYPTSWILNNWKMQRFGNWICFSLQVSEGRQLLCSTP